MQHFEAPDKIAADRPCRAETSRFSNAFATSCGRGWGEALVAMLTLLETVLGPLWVWLVIGEEPGGRTLIGGAIVIGALFVHAAWRLRRAPAAGLTR